MTTLNAGSQAAFDNLTPSEGALAFSSGSSITIGFTPIGGKQQTSLKLSGSFDAQGNVLTLTQGSYLNADGSAATLLFTGSAQATLPYVNGVLRADLLMQALLPGDDWFTLGDKADAVHAGNGNDLVQAGGGNDRIMGGGGDDAIGGGAGIDTAVYAGARSRYTLATNANGFTLADQTTGAAGEGRDTLTGVERLEFADKRLALDLDGHAGQAAKILGAVFGAKTVANREYMGIGLQLLDQGMSYEAVAALAVGATGTSKPADVVNLLWGHVIGGTPTAAQAQPFIDMLNGGMSIGALTVLAADTPYNTANIDLVGLAKTGVEYIPGTV